MALVQAYARLDMSQYTSWYGNVVFSSSNQIVISDGFRETIYDGSGFTYGWDGRLTGGTLSRIREVEANQLVLDAQGLNINARTADHLIGSNSIPALLEIALQGNDRIVGSPQNDVIYGFAGNDIIFGGAGNDYIHAGAGNDIVHGGLGRNTIDGGSGFDVALYDGWGSNFFVARRADSIEVRRTDNAIHDDLYNIQRVSFDNGTLAFDAGAAGMFRIYQAAFDRTPDTPGLSFWVQQSDGGMGLVEAATRFTFEAEFRAVYGPNPTNEDYIDRLYLHVLDRLPDFNGYEYWNNQMDSGMSRGEVLARFADSPENHAKVAGAIQDGIWVDFVYSV